MLPVLHSQPLVHGHGVVVAHPSVLNNLFPATTMLLECPTGSYPWPLSFLAQNLPLLVVHPTTGVHAPLSIVKMIGLIRKALDDLSSG